MSAVLILCVASQTVAQAQFRLPGYPGVVVWTDPSGDIVVARQGGFTHAEQVFAIQRVLENLTGCPMRAKDPSELTLQEFRPDCARARAVAERRVSSNRSKNARSGSGGALAARRAADGVEIPFLQQFFAAQE